MEPILIHGSCPREAAELIDELEATTEEAMELAATWGRLYEDAHRMSMYMLGSCVAQSMAIHDMTLFYLNHLIQLSTRIQVLIIDKYEALENQIDRSWRRGYIWNNKISERVVWNTPYTDNLDNLSWPDISSGTVLPAGWYDGADVSPSGSRTVCAACWDDIVPHTDHTCAILGHRYYVSEIRINSGRQNIDFLELYSYETQAAFIRELQRERGILQSSTFSWSGFGSRDINVASNNNIERHTVYMNDVPIGILVDLIRRPDGSCHATIVTPDGTNWRVALDLDALAENPPRYQAQTF